MGIDMDAVYLDVTVRQWCFLAPLIIGSLSIIIYGVFFYKDDDPIDHYRGRY
jgi:hypothetical protein